MSGGLERSCATKSKSTVCTYRLRPKRSVWRHSPASAEQILPSVGPQRPCILWQVSCIRQKSKGIFCLAGGCVEGLHDPAPRIQQQRALEIPQASARHHPSQARPQFSPSSGQDLTFHQPNTFVRTRSSLSFPKAPWPCLESCFQPLCSSNAT